MTPQARLQVQSAVKLFQSAPTAATADTLLSVLGPLRKDSVQVRSMIDDVLDFKLVTTKYGDACSSC